MGERIPVVQGKNLEENPWKNCEPWKNHLHLDGNMWDFLAEKIPLNQVREGQSPWSERTLDEY